MADTAKVCVADGGTLVPAYDREAFTMHTAIGIRLRSWLKHWACETCGLLYAPGVMPDPRIEAEQAAEAERQRASQERFDRDFEKTFGPMIERIRAAARVVELDKEQQAE